MNEPIYIRGPVDAAYAGQAYKRPPSWLWVAVYVAAGVVLAVVL